MFFFSSFFFFCFVFFFLVCFLNFGIAFNTVSQNILQDKMPSFVAGEEHNTKGEELAEGSGSKSGSKEGNIRLVDSPQRCSH